MKEITKSGICIVLFAIVMLVFTSCGTYMKVNGNSVSEGIVTGMQNYILSLRDVDLDHVDDEDINNVSYEAFYNIKGYYVLKKECEKKNIFPSDFDEQVKLHVDSTMNSWGTTPSDDVVNSKMTIEDYEKKKVTKEVLQIYYGFTEILKRQYKEYLLKKNPITKKQIKTYYKQNIKIYNKYWKGHSRKEIDENIKSNLALRLTDNKIDELIKKAKITISGSKKE